ncbi:hypothetical protein G3H63_06830 [Microbacterium resistens]|uniref:arsenate reductase/protein-tyrosine-phosphatase family protein n=1 Tax=Microbacterium resistens TaxID=156977 RepID=UPI001C55CBDA|nr:hypothetical protein [Microbacterium resistens]MBW1638798.1 hypothetical protein [Microbacterium resistens]
MTGRADLLLLCEANVCRSPLAELVIARRLGAHEALAEVEVASAGVRAEGGRAVCGRVRRVETDQDWADRTSAHRSRPVDAADLDAAALVLTASRAVRAGAVSLSPAARRRVFTVREALWLADGMTLPRGEGRDAVAALAEALDARRGLRPLPGARRSFLRRRDTDPLDIRDGHVLGGTAHEQTVQDVVETSGRVAGLLIDISVSP